MELGQKQAPLTATFQTRSARNADRDIQLPDGRIATRPLCCFPLLPTRTHTQTHIHLCWASHVSVQPPPTSSTCWQMHVSSMCPINDVGTESQTWLLCQHSAVPALFTTSAIPRHSFILFIGIFWDTVLIMGWWE